MAKSLKDQLHDIEQNGGTVPAGYTYNPRRSPRLEKKTVANRQQNDTDKDTDKVTDTDAGKGGKKEDEA